MSKFQPNTLEAKYALNDRTPCVDPEKLEDALPHGSGIDMDWKFEVCQNGNIFCHNSYHGMDEGGMYDGWQDFYVKIFRHRQDVVRKLEWCGVERIQVHHFKNDIDFYICFTGQRLKRSWTYGLRDYLEETVHYCLTEAKIVDPRCPVYQLVAQGPPLEPPTKELKPQV